MDEKLFNFGYVDMFDKEYWIVFLFKIVKIVISVIGVIVLSFIIFLSIWWWYYC